MKERDGRYSASFFILPIVRHTIQEPIMVVILSVLRPRCICAATDNRTDICAPIRYCVSLRCNKRCNILSDVASLPDLQIPHRNLFVFIYVLLLFCDFHTDTNPFFHACYRRPSS